MWRHLFAISGVIVGGCADQGRVYPLDDASLRAGIPKFEFVPAGDG